ncbi:CBS domain-containing protein [Amycolatopsis panacis]|uniref:CBS domain-containing protein n=1 Tax=Amycolatopsis panacis TaxID=2340917 RepID=A0A419I4V0_9PSEU|nr:CBS domain-containing protein [Amycolatopsis panacis]RJQ85497.1 CBS domain-containing protein [Amycolatopsis panacis]
MQTRDIMTTPVIAVTATASFAEASRLMTRHGFTTVPVVDSRGNLLGLLSEEDLIRAGFPDQADPDAEVLLGRNRVVASVMRAPDLAAQADLDVADLANHMAEARVRALPVVEGRTLVGMVTYQDVLRVLPAAGLS